MTADYQDLLVLCESRIPLIVIETRDEPRALLLLRRIGRGTSRPVFQWTVTRGLQRLDAEGASLPPFPADADAVLDRIARAQQPAVYVLCDYHDWLQDNPLRVRQLRDIALAADRLGHTVVFVSHALALPPELEAHAARFQPSLPDDKALQEIVREEARAWTARNPGRELRADSAVAAQLVRILAGLPHEDARRLARQALVDDGALTDADLPEVNRAKFELMDMDGVLHFELDTRDLADVGGLGRLKQWLAVRRLPFLGASEALLDTPRGVLLLGVQGGGKSLAARCVAGSWQLPLLRMDAGALYNKFHGETERNLRETLRLADAMAPCVLWVDEIEKALAREAHDGGTSARVLGTLLTWMAERRSRVFLVATANDISSLPAELLRKGRLDEIFFVDLPDAAARRDIFRIHLRKRGIDDAGLDLAALADVTAGFTGAEIEQAIVSARYRAHGSGASVTTTLLREEIATTRPLSVTMAEKVQALRQWAAERAVLAD